MSEINRLRAFAVQFARKKLEKHPQMSMGVTEEDIAHIALIDHLRNWETGICSSEAFIGRSIMHEIDRRLRSRKTHFCRTSSERVKFCGCSISR